MESASLHKKLIRSRIKNIVKQLTKSEQQQAAALLTALIKNYLNLPANQHYQHFACYWPTKYEINSLLLINFLLVNNKNCYLPIISNNRLNFVQYNSNTKLIKNNFGILEPEFEVNNMINIINLDIIFMPLIAFDAAGNRIGRGKGMYDRALANNNHAKLIGLGYSIQQVSPWQPDPWDIKLNMIFTEKELLLPLICH